MENVAFIARKKITMDKFSTQVKVTANSQIKKILKVISKSNISSCDFVNDLVSIGGKVKTTVVYVNKDNEIESAEMQTDYIEKQQSSFKVDDVFASDTLEVKNVNYSGVDVICVLEHSVVINGNYSYEIPELDETDKNLVIKKSKFEALKYISSCEDNFVVAEECETNLNDINVICTDAKVILNEVITLVDKISIEGKIYTNLFYSDEQGLSSYAKDFEFKQEIASSGVVPSMISNVLARVNEVTVTMEETDGKSNLVYSISLFAKGMTYEEAEFNTIDDIFSLKNYLQTKYDFISAKNYIETKNYADNFLSTTDISQIENFDDILGVYFPKCTIISVDNEEEKSVLSANISSLAIYKSGEEFNELKLDLPVKIEISKEKQTYIGDVVIVPEISSFKVKAGKNLEVVYHLNYDVTFEKIVSEKYLKSFEVKGEKNDNSSGIKIYVTRQGENLFDVAKSLNMRPEIIEKQNSEINCFEQGEKIYVYSPINLYN